MIREGGSINGEVYVDPKIDLSEIGMSPLKEAITQLELSLEDRGWTKIGLEGQSTEFSRGALRTLCQLSRIYFLKNPLVNRAVTVQASYVFGQGVTITARNKRVNEVVQAFLDDPQNKAELTSHQAMTLKEQDLQVYGNLFFAFFTNASSGKVRVRSIPIDEVEDIICNPDDRKERWFYKRRWFSEELNTNSTEATTSQPKEMVAYYPDWSYNPPVGDRIGSIDGKRVRWDVPVYHVRVGCLSDMKFGVPETYQAIDWAKAYKEFLEDWATIVKSLSMFAWKAKTTGGSKQVDAMKSKLQSGITTSSGETNPPPPPGSVMFEKEGAEFSPIRTAGFTTSAEDGRRLLLMVCASFGIPETYFGDISVGTLATARSMDRPTELKFSDRQILWDDVLTDICRFVIKQNAKAPNGDLPGRVIIDDEGRQQVEVSKRIDIHVAVSFPPILEHNPRESVGAIIDSATLRGGQLAGTMTMPFTTRLLLGALGVPNIDEVMEKTFPGGEDVPPPSPPTSAPAPAAAPAAPAAPAAAPAPAKE